MVGKINRIVEVKSSSTKVYMIDMIDADGDSHSFPMTMYQFLQKEIVLDTYYLLIGRTALQKNEHPVVNAVSTSHQRLQTANVIFQLSANRYFTFPIEKNPSMSIEMVGAITVKTGISPVET